ncbi:MAG TPA: hypothetical protein VIN07_06155 [Flavipsychrobacter sp.]
MENKGSIIRQTVVITFVSTLIFSFLLFYGGCRGMYSYIESRRDCRSMNVDNYEVRTHTDIPSPKETLYCNYDAAKGVKSSIFQLKLTEKKLRSSIAYDGLKKISECNLPVFRYNPEWNDSISKLPQHHIYATSGSYKEDSWIYVLDSANQTMWAELVEDLNYKD